MSAYPLNSDPPIDLHALSSRKELTLQEKLLLREAQLSQAQRMAGMASWEWYFGTTEIRWSPEMYRFWGYMPNEVSVDLESVAKSTHSDDLPILETAVQRLLQGDDVEMEYRRYDKMGREIFIYTNGQIIHNEAGEPIGVFGIDMDITRRKQQEQHLLELNRLLEEKNQKLEQLVSEANALTYVASHDLQEPLRKIKSFNELILEKEAGTLSEQGKEFFRRSIASANRMQHLIRDLVAYSQLNAVKHPVESVDLMELVNEACDDQYDVIREKQAEIEIGELPAVQVSKLPFRQLLDNLLANALKYHRPGLPPTIQIMYDRLAIGETDPAEPSDSDQHQLTIADQGIGFEPVYSDRIFKVFRRLHSQHHYAGTGIGLAICQRVMQNHGGTIEAIGKPGEGATFILRWPVESVHT
ncbi:sensor histidine kinase [Fibrivirga algicola]|uniref:histidine kinase n=1 Tax=Fibrivirga algicola TaxID=2950420 RepID=A0ABX0QK10_9BACT|nr:PAS domain-containing sensor histidine kinase [Fibrivirga algicola]NID12619.1 PAS domain-containing protein [Fibrivirga algicola]